MICSEQKLENDGCTGTGSGCWLTNPFFKQLLHDTVHVIQTLTEPKLCFLLQNLCERLCTDCSFMESRVVSKICADVPENLRAEGEQGEGRA